MVKLSLSVVAILISVTCLAAQQRTVWSDPEFEASGFAGGSWAGNLHFPTSVSGSALETSRTVGVRYGSGYVVGARVNQNVNDYWGAALEYSFANQPLQFTNLSPTIQSLSLGQTVHHFLYNVSYIPLGGFERFRPYAQAGGGATLFYIHGDSRDEALALGVYVRDSWKFTVNWGGGFKYMVDDQTALLFDVKDSISGVPSYGLPSAAQVINGQFQPGLASSGRLNIWQVNFGVAFRWNDW
jgi:hypothetical protein